ncbi:MAG: hypothetical protein J0L88_03470 [Xanthomonadales bacterium]|nr:hypothetical protein [Xanthomonadales bacterium]
MLIASVVLSMTAWAQVPVIEFEALTPTTLTLPDGAEANVQYRLTNRSLRPRTWTMMPIPGISVLAGAGLCPQPSTLAPLASCVLSLRLVGSQMGSGVHGGPIVCWEQFACARPSAADLLAITVVASPRALITATPAVVSFAAGGTATVSIANDAASTVTAQALTVDVPPGSTIDVDLGTCVDPLPPAASCELHLGAIDPQPTAILVIAGSNTVETSIEVTVTDTLFTDGFEGIAED